MITKLSCAIIVYRCHQDDRGAYPALRPCPADTALGGVALRPTLGADRPHPRRPQGGALSDRRPDNCSAYENQPRSCRDPETLWNIIAKEAAHSHRAAAGQGRLMIHALFRIENPSENRQTFLTSVSWLRSRVYGSNENCWLTGPLDGNRAVTG